MSCLRYRLFLPSKTSILQVISNEKKHCFKLLCWNVNDKFTIDRAGYQSKHSRKKYSSSFLRSTRPPSPSGICGTLPLPLVLLTTTAKKKTLFAGIHISLRGIADFTEQRTAFTRAQSAILHGQDFNLRVERARKIPYSRS